MAVFLKETFGLEAFSTPSAVDRAHRIAVPHREQGDPPHPFIARIHNYQTKEHILKLAKEAGSLSLRGSVIHIYPAYSLEVSKKRAAYAAVKASWEVPESLIGCSSRPEINFLFAWRSFLLPPKQSARYVSHIGQRYSIKHWQQTVRLQPATLRYYTVKSPVYPSWLRCYVFKYSPL